MWGRRCASSYASYSSSFLRESPASLPYCEYPRCTTTSFDSMLVLRRCGLGAERRLPSAWSHSVSDQTVVVVGRFRSNSKATNIHCAQASRESRMCRLLSSIGSCSGRCSRVSSFHTYPTKHGSPPLLACIDRLSTIQYSPPFQFHPSARPYRMVR